METCSSFIYNKEAMITFKIKIADTVLEINAFNETTKRYCKDFLCDEEAEFTITLSEQDLKNEVTESSNGQVYVNEEISALYRKIADLFVERNIVVFHGSSFKVKDNGFIVTARSGVGKSTHVKLLEQYIGDDFFYINDDKPLVRVNDDIIIYSSPWNGKERRGNNTSAPLKAVLFLNRAVDNTYKPIINKEEIYIRLLSQIYLPRDKDKREKALKIVDALLKKINFYEINVNKELESAKMTYEEIITNEIK